MKNICFIILLLLSDISYSQGSDTIADKRHFLGIETGIGYFRIKDTQESPLIYGHLFVPLHLSYLYSNTKSISELNIFYFNNTLKSSITNQSYLSTNNLCLGLNFDFLKKINLTLPDNYIFYAGGSFINFTSYRNHNMGDRHRLNADVFSQISIKWRIIKELSEKSCIYWDCSAPALSYVMLRRYNLEGFPDEATDTSFDDWDLLRDGDFLTVNRFIDIWSRVQYEKQIGNRWYITSDYLFRFYHYYRYKNYFPVNAGINAIELGLKFKL